MIIILFLMLSYAIFNYDYNRDFPNGSFINIQGYPISVITLDFKRDIPEGSYKTFKAILPDDWKTDEKIFYSNPIRVIISPSPTSIGNYIIPVTFYDPDYPNLPNTTIFLNITIKRDVFSLNFPKKIAGNYKQPIRFQLEILSKEPAVYVIEVSSYNNFFKKEIFIKDRYIQTIELIYPYPANFNTTIKVYPKYAENLAEIHVIETEVYDNIFKDFQAINYGILVYYHYNYLLQAFISIFYQILNPNSY
jgi:hypothetical protein